MHVEPSEGESWNDIQAKSRVFYMSKNVLNLQQSVLMGRDINQIWPTFCKRLKAVLLKNTTKVPD